MYKSAETLTPIFKRGIHPEASGGLCDDIRSEKGANEFVSLVQRVHPCGNRETNHYSAPIKRCSVLTHLSAMTIEGKIASGIPTAKGRNGTNLEQLGHRACLIIMNSRSSKMDTYD